MLGSGLSALAAFAFFATSNKDKDEDEEKDEKTSPETPAAQDVLGATSEPKTLYQEFSESMKREEETDTLREPSTTAALASAIVGRARRLLEHNQMLRLGSGAQDHGWDGGINVPFKSKHWKKGLERKQADYTQVNTASSERGYKLKTARKKSTETLAELREEFGIPGITVCELSLELSLLNSLSLS